MNNLYPIHEGRRSKMSLVLLPGVLLPGSSDGAVPNDLYNKAYHLWKDVWESTLKELDGVAALHSDQFTRQDLVAALMRGDQCIALTCFRQTNLLQLAHRQDSWFIPWDEKRLIELGAQYPRGLISSFFTVHPEFRKTSVGGDISKLLTEVVSYVGWHSGVDVTFGVTRNNRSVNRLAYYGGAVALEVCRKHHGVEVDLVAFFPEQIQIAIQAFSKEIAELWNNRLEYQSPYFGVKNHHEKAA